jgi:hypothetical protein
MGSGTQLREVLDKLIPSQVKTTEQQEDFDLPLPELTPEEEMAAIKLAREAKREAERVALLKKAYWDKVTSEPEIKLYTADQLEGILKSALTPTGKKVVVDKDNKWIIELICKYFANNPSFETHKDINGSNYSLNKGLAMMGNVGVGKTFLMAFFHNNQNQSYVMANCRKIESLWVDQMSSKEKPLKNVVDYYASSIPLSLNSNPFGHLVAGTCFDDLGTETSPSKAYGEEKNVLGEILMNRYESGLPFNYTHITTNLSSHDIGLKYGNRVRDRFREMFNLIMFDNEAKSRRA